MTRYKLNAFTGKLDRVGGNSNNSGLPVGTILAFPTTSIPSNFLWADGSLYPTALYPDLFALIGYTYGGSGANFAVPNTTDRFLKGDNGTNIGTLNGSNTLTENQLPIVNLSGTISVSQNDGDITATNGAYFANPNESGGLAIDGFVANGNQNPVVSIAGVNVNFGNGYPHEHPHLVVRYAICYASISAGVASPTPSWQATTSVGNTTTNPIIIGSSTALTGTTANLQLKGAMLIDNIGSSFTTSTSVVRENLEILLSTATRFAHSINTNVNANTTLLNRQLRGFSSNFNYAGVFDSTSAYVAHFFNVNHSNTGTNTNGGSYQYYTNVLANTNITGNSTTNGISALVGRIVTINPSFAGTITEVNAVSGEFQSGTSTAVSGSITTLNLLKVHYNPNTAFLPTITNLRGIHIDSSIDTITSLNKFALLSDSVAPSRFVGDLQLYNLLSLRGAVNFVNIKARTSTLPYTLNLPLNMGTDGQILTTNGIDEANWTDLNSIQQIIAPPTYTSVINGTIADPAVLQGQMAVDANWVYICFIDGVWTRVPKDLTTT